MRLDWDRYFLRIAGEVATRATCDRKHVGCVLVRERMIVATGYNGSMRGLDHCDDVGHLMEGQICQRCTQPDHVQCPDGKEHVLFGGHCVRTVHAEANAVAQAARSGSAVDGATAYVTAAPCWICFRLLVNAGVKRVVFGEAYRLDRKVVDHASQAGVELIDLSVDG